MNDFTHLDSRGQANMVDVASKKVTKRRAVAQARVVLSPEIMQKISQGEVAKGDLLAVSRVAGIQAAKKCSELIPLCHPLPLNRVAIDIEPFEQAAKSGLEIRATCETEGKTGVEMEALTAASVSALSIYDMCKALDKGIEIEQVCLLHKSGGKSGIWDRRAGVGEEAND